MDLVLDRLYIGSSVDCTAPLRSLGFSALLDLRNGPVQVVDVAHHRVTNRDGDPWSPRQVSAALDFVGENIARGKVLVACVAGMSRSACMTIGYLVRCGWSATEAHGLVRAARPTIAPIPKMLDSVLRVALPSGA